MTHYYLQDANYNVVAVVQPAGGGYPAQVLYQYTYGPYGDVLAADVIPPPGAPPGWAPPVNRVGFQGLFLEPVLFNVSNPGLSTSSMSLWCARNRFILSSIGRFLTRDPAEAAMPILTALTFNGDTLDGLAGGPPMLPAIAFRARTPMLPSSSASISHPLHTNFRRSAGVAAQSSGPGPAQSYTRLSTRRHRCSALGAYTRTQFDTRRPR